MGRYRGRYSNPGAAQAGAAAAVAQTITNGVTTSAPSQDAVFDALALKAPLASPTFTGDVVVPDANAATEAMNQQTSDARYLRADLAGTSLENVGAIESTVNTVAATGAAETLDTSVYAFHDVTMDENCTFTFSNPAPSGDASVFVLILRGAFTPTFPASVDWPDAAAPTYATPTIYTFITVDAGTTWLGTSAGKAFG